MKQQVSDLVAVVKANQVGGKSKGTTTQQNSNNNRNQANKGPQILGGTGHQSSAAEPSKNNQVVCQCYCCWGWGHMGKECTIPLNYSKGRASIFLPTESRRPKRAGSSTDPAQTNSIILKAVKEHCHIPDPIANLTGKVNETQILVYDVECVTLVDSGAHLSTITIDFLKQLGLKIHQLDRILGFEATGGGGIPYMGYIEVNLKIPEIKEFDEDVLMLVTEDRTYAQHVLIQLGILHIDRALDLIRDKEITQLSKKMEMK